MVLIKTEQKNIKISPQKLRLVVNSIKNLSPQEALDNLRFLNKKGAKILAKVIKQALANATHNKKLNSENLKFARIEVNKGRVFKRWRPVSRGRAHSILKRTSHILVKLKTENEKIQPKIKNQ